MRHLRPQARDKLWTPGSDAGERLLFQTGTVYIGDPEGELELPQRLELRGHVVERARELGHIVIAPNGNSGRCLARGKASDRVLPQRPDPVRTDRNDHCMKSDCTPGGAVVSCRASCGTFIRPQYLTGGE